MFCNSRAYLLVFGVFDLRASAIHVVPQTGADAASIMGTADAASAGKSVR